MFISILDFKKNFSFASHHFRHHLGCTERNNHCQAINIDYCTEALTIQFGFGLFTVRCKKFPYDREETYGSTVRCQLLVLPTFFSIVNPNRQSSNALINAPCTGIPRKFLRALSLHRGSFHMCVISKFRSHLCHWTITLFGTL